MQTTALQAGLARYDPLRDFGITAEPPSEVSAEHAGPQLQFVVQKHWASSLPYDFRLGLDGVMLSLAVPEPVESSVDFGRSNVVDLTELLRQSLAPGLRRLLPRPSRRPPKSRTLLRRQARRHARRPRKSHRRRKRHDWQWVCVGRSVGACASCLARELAASQTTGVIALGRTAKRALELLMDTPLDEDNWRIDRGIPIEMLAHSAALLGAGQLEGSTGYERWLQQMALALGQSSTAASQQPPN